MATASERGAVRVNLNDAVTGLIIALLIMLSLFRTILARNGIDLPRVETYIFILAALGAVAAVNVVSRRPVIFSGVSIFYFFLIILMFLYFQLSATWSISSVKIVTDIEVLWFDIALCLVFLFAISKNAYRPIFISTALCGISASVFAIYLYFFDPLYSLSGGVLSEFRIIIARVIGVGCIISTCYAIFSGHNRTAWSVAAFIGVIGIGLSLTRGTFLSVFALIIFLLTIASFKLPQNQKFRLSRLGQFLIIVSLLVVAVHEMLITDNYGQRFVALFNSVAPWTRGGIWDVAWDVIWDGNLSSWWIVLFGNGVGSAAITIGRMDGDYPHNLLIEAYLDGGLIGLSILVSAIGIPVWRGLTTLLRKKNIGHLDLPWLCSYSVLLLLLMEYSKSQTWYGARDLFVFMFLTVAALNDRSVQAMKSKNRPTFIKAHSLG